MRKMMMKMNRIIGSLAMGAMFWACSDGDSDSMDLGGGASGDAGITAVVDWEVAGVSQKGPFVTGSAVTVQELDGITLKQTGKSFKGTIKSDKGDFAIKDINLESQYAILEASGYYRDEISGKKSSSQVTLRALTDLKDRKHVNINLLTHLEYERVMYLVTEKKKSIAEAKEQAEKEVLATFGIEGDFAESEDLNIFETGDGNAALLAISVLLQSDVDVAGLTERMGEFSISFAEGGSWDDADTKTAIADWACDIDLKGSLSTVRKNVEDWKYADTVPAFEKYVTNFWWNNYGLGVCNDKRENETKRNINKLSNLYNEYFVCEKGRWHIPGDEPLSSSSFSAPVEALSSSSEETSSSSIYNPFVTQDPLDTIPPLPEQFSFIDTSYDKKGYRSYGDGKQEVWMFRYDGRFGDLKKNSRDSVAKSLVDAMGAMGFSFDGVVKNDSVGDSNNGITTYYADSSFLYSKTENGTVYKLGITESAYTYVGYATYYCIDVKVVVLKDGFKEESTLDYGMMRYETDLSDELNFIQDYATEKKRRSYNEDSLFVSWQVLHLTDSGSVQSVSLVADLAKENAAADSLELFKAALLENGFTVAETDYPNVHVGFDSYINVAMVDSTRESVRYVKETSLAKHWVQVSVGEVFRYVKDSQGEYSDQGYYLYCYVINVQTRYKEKPKRTVKPE